MKYYGGIITYLTTEGLAIETLVFPSKNAETASAWLQGFGAGAGFPIGADIHTLELPEPKSEEEALKMVEAIKNAMFPYNSPWDGTLPPDDSGRWN